MSRERVSQVQSLLFHPYGRMSLVTLWLVTLTEPSDVVLFFFIETAQDNTVLVMQNDPGLNLEGIACTREGLKSEAIKAFNRLGSGELK